MASHSNLRRHQLRIDDETWSAVTDLAALQSENNSAVVRDGLRFYLRRHGYQFSNEPVRRNRRGMGRKAK